MLAWRRIFGIAAVVGLILMSCEPETVVITPDDTPAHSIDKPDEPQTPVTPTGTIIPADMTSIPIVSINTPNKVGVNSKNEWLEKVSIAIIDDMGKTLYSSNNLKIRGRGNSTWWNPKKPYALKLYDKADFFGTGKSRKWVLLANYIDRTLLRNVVAFEAARMTSIDWTPSGRFVELYMDGVHQGLYWLCEKINVEGSKFEAEYLYSFDISDFDEVDFEDDATFCANTWSYGAPVEIKYPDRDNYPNGKFSTVVTAAKKKLKSMTDGISSGSLKYVDIDSFCDWYLVHELTFNLEPNHPKSCFFHWRKDKMYAGPVWDFDWYTFIPTEQSLGLKYSLWYNKLLENTEFKTRLKQRWAELKPKFETLPDFVDAQADLIRESEAVNQAMWPSNEIWINYDERMTFQEAVDRMKLGITNRIAVLDREITAL